MLIKLSEKQIQLMDEVKNYWIDKSWKYVDLKYQDLEAHYEWLYSLINLPKPFVVVLDGPMDLQIAANTWGNLESQVESQVGSQVESQVRSQVESQVRSQVESQVRWQVWSQVGSQVRSQVESQVRSQVESQVASQVGSQVESQVGLQIQSQVESQVELQVRWQVRSQVGLQVGSQVESQVRSQVESQVRSQVRSQKNFIYYNCWESQLISDSAWVSFYDYFTQISIINFELFNKYKKVLKSGIWMSILLNDIVFVCAAPTKVFRRPDGIVHNANGAAYEFKNGEKYYVLNGTSIPSKYFETNHTFQDILKEPNVEIRSELIRREGIIKFINHLPSRLLDREGTYELYSIDLTNNHKNTKWLKMKNPSVDNMWHLEAVSKDCKKVTEALHDRKPEALKKLPVRLDGDNWYQQGDVCIWPDGATAVKPLPKILT